MNFRRGQRAEDPEINLVPLIDVMLVIIIFLMLTTTYSKFSELQITLPTADAEKMQERPAEISIEVTADGRYQIDKVLVAYKDPQGLADALKQAAAKGKDPIILISADAAASHQSVINVMEAARIANLPRISFVTKNTGS